MLLKRNEGSWSLQEHIGHLLDLEPLWIGRVEDLLAGAETLRPADLSNAKTHAADHNARPLAEILADLAKDRGTLLARMQDLTVSDFGRSALHPRLQQPMRMIDLVNFVAEQDDHHLTRMTELLR